MLYQLSTKELFFKVKESSFSAKIESGEISANGYKILSHEDTGLGIKPLRYGNENVFFVDHKLAFYCGKMLAKSISPSLIDDRSYSNEVKNISFIFIGQSDYLKEEENTIRPFDSSLFDELKSYGFTPSIGIQNGLDYEGIVCFYLLIEQSISISESGYLTIAKYKFDSSTIKNIITDPSSKNEYALRNIQERGIPSFKTALKEFLEKYKQLSSIKTNQKELTAVALDIYNKKLNEETLLSDDSYRKEIEVFKDNALRIFENQKKMNALISFIVRYQKMDFSESKIKSNLITDVLKEKDAFKNLKRLTEGKNRNIEERKKYINAQVRAYENIMNYL